MSKTKAENSFYLNYRAKIMQTLKFAKSGIKSKGVSERTGQKLSQTGREYV